ncbi:MAG: hypothetical protein AAFV53_38440, partial [Myxococcota bacterium]
MNTTQNPSNCSGVKLIFEDELERALEQDAKNHSVAKPARFALKHAPGLAELLTELSPKQTIKAEHTLNNHPQ